MENSTMMQAVGAVIARHLDPRDLQYLSMEELEALAKKIGDEAHETARMRREYLAGDALKEAWHQAAAQVCPTR